MSLSKEHVVIREIVEDNKKAAHKAYLRGDYVSCFLLMHSLIEALLRAFLSKTKRETFKELIKTYEKFLKQARQKKPTFANELIKFNKGRNK